MKQIWETIIIDDEPLARERLSRLLNDFQSEIRIIDEAVDGDDAFKKIETLKPDLIFLDIQMPGKDVFKMLKELEHKPFVVFCTAFDKYILESFEAFSLDYLLKPIEKERLKLTIQKLKKIEVLYNKISYEYLVNLNINNSKPTSINHKLGNKIVPVKLEEIVYFNANDKYVNFYNQKSNKFITDFSLQSLQEKLPENFLRISKSIIINTNFIIELNKYFKSRFTFKMNDYNQNRLISGGTFNQQIKQYFEL